MSTADRRRQMERVKDSIETRQEDEQVARQQRRHLMATTRKTAVGDRVPKWPSTEAVFALIEETDKAMRELFAEAQSRLEADDVIEERRKRATSERFNVLGGQ